MRMSFLLMKRGYIGARLLDKIVTSDFRKSFLTSPSRKSCVRTRTYPSATFQFFHQFKLKHEPVRDFWTGQHGDPGVKGDICRNAAAVEEKGFSKGFYSPEWPNFRPVILPFVP